MSIFAHLYTYTCHAICVGETVALPLEAQWRSLWAEMMQKARNLDDNMTISLNEALRIARETPQYAELGEDALQHLQDVDDACEEVEEGRFAFTSERLPLAINQSQRGFREDIVTAVRNASHYVFADRLEDHGTGYCTRILEVVSRDTRNGANHV